ncbi:MAG TPA: response regulator [Candidatus Latescibacteria bacterium]|nr:response regulator [Candidatus Latescibacterota bacterium]
MQRRILIVEDNGVNRNLVRVLLQKYGYQIIEATDGEEAVEVAVREKPDLILMDIQLPRMSGYSATGILKGRRDTMDIPIIALTAKAMIGDREKALKAGCDGYISKPIDTRELPKVVNSLLDRERPRGGDG